MSKNKKRSVRLVGAMAKEIVTTGPTRFVLPSLPKPSNHEVADDRVDGLRKLTVIGILISGVFFTALIGWANFAELASAAMAKGVVTVASNRKTIQHFEGGIVKQILVRNGDSVTAGQLLVRLDGTRTYGSLDQLRGQKRAAQALIARLSAERDGLGRIEFVPGLLALRGDKKVDGLLRVQQDIFEARRKSVRTKSSIISQRIIQFKKEIEGINAQISSDNEQLKLINQELRGVKTLYDKKLISVVRLLSLQRNVAKNKGARASKRSQVVTTQPGQIKHSPAMAD
jgi:HlyD family type I secretion membrane fusion protein